MLLFISAISMLVALGLAVWVTDQDDFKVSVGLCGVVLLACVSIGTAVLFGLRQGQIDAINGNIYYQLQKQSDGTLQWEWTGPSTQPANK